MKKKHIVDMYLVVFKASSLNVPCQMQVNKTSEGLGNRFPSQP